MPDQKRILTSRPVEIRKSNGKTTFRGYAAVFYREDEPGTEYELYPGLVERIAPAAFNRAIAEGQNVRGLVNHDPNQVIGRVPKTMRLSVDDVGLAYEIDAPDTQLGRDLAVLMEREDIAGSSFAFSVRRQSIARSDGQEIRTLEDLDLHDVGPVTYPAYEATTAQIRSLAQKEAEARSAKMAAHEGRQAILEKYGLTEDGEVE